jgi:Tfp pilus assembly protein PilN
MQTSLNFARRPFRDERPAYLVIGVALAIAAVFLFANWRLYVGFHRAVAGTTREIDALQVRKEAATKATADAKTALNSYRVSSLAKESRGLLQLVAAHRFSWIELLTRLEQVLPPDVRVSRLTPYVLETGQVSISLSLVGRDGDSVVHTIAALSRDPAFSAVEIHSESSQERGVPEGHTFEVAARYVPEVTR